VRQTFVVLADLPPEQQAWFDSLGHRARLAFGGHISSVREDLAQAAGLFVWGHPHDPFDQVLEAAPRLRWVHYTGAGIEHLLVPSFVRSSIPLTNSRGIHSPAVAELALTLLLAIAKGLPNRVRAQAEHRWTQELNRGLNRATLVVVGLGSIGSAVARTASALGMQVIGVRRTARRARWAHDVVAFSDLDRVLPRAEYIVLCCPETDETRGLIGAAQLRRLPRGAILVNVARGTIVDEPALIEALRDGHLAGAGLDVFSSEPLAPHSPLWDLPNVLITPHYPNVRGWERETVQRFVENAERFLDRRPLRNVVDKRRGY
jgi:phosphoglycerate dehydrogenase-like enzyme